MKYLIMTGFLLTAMTAEANSAYLLTPEELEAGLAIRNAEKEDSDDAVLGIGTTTGLENAGSGSTIGGLSGLLATAGQTVIAGAPIIAQIAVAAAATSLVLKYGQGLLAAGVTLACTWLGLPLDISTTIGLGAPLAIEEAGGWLKRKLLRV